MSDETELLAAFGQGDTPDVAPTPEPVVEPAAPPADPAAPVEKAPVTLDDDVPVEFKVGGQVIRKAWKEILQQQAMLPADYTRKMQALAAERDTFKQEFDGFSSAKQQYEAEKAQLAAALRDPKKIEALYLAAVAAGGGQPQATAQPAFDPNTLAKTVLDQARAEVTSQFKALQDAQIKAGQEQTLEQHVSNILTANPALNALPNVNDYLYSEVAKMVEKGKSTVEDAKQMLNLVASSISDNLSQHFTAVKTKDVVAAAQLKNGIEPRGGAPVMPTAKKYNPKLGLDDPEMEADIKAFLTANQG